MKGRVLLAVTCASLSALTGCNGHGSEWDRTALDKAVTSHLRESDQRGFTVTCPAGTTLQAGSKVYCRVTNLDSILGVWVEADSDGRLQFVSNVHL